MAEDKPKVSKEQVDQFEMEYRKQIKFQKMVIDETKNEITKIGIENKIGKNYKKQFDKIKSNFELKKLNKWVD